MKVSQVVASILETNRQSRNSDKELQIQFMNRMGMDLSEYQMRTFREMPTLETVRRIRQKYQENGKYLADQKIGKERKFKSMRMQQIAPIAKPEYIQRVLEWGE